MAYKITLFFTYVITCLSASLHKISSSLGIQSKPPLAWWNPIIESSGATLYLGALPIKKKNLLFKEVRNDADALEKLKIGAVLTMTETFENHAKGPFISAVTPSDWKNKQIRHLQIPTRDFKTIDLEKIHQAVAFIHANMQAGISVYVHCKAGLGRSALITLCYLIKHHNMSAEQARQTVREQRRQVGPGATQWATAQEYERLIASQNQHS